MDGAVLLNQPKEVQGPSFVGGALYLLGYVQEKINDTGRAIAAANEAGDREQLEKLTEAIRSYDLAMSHVEDAVYRFNRAAAIEGDVFKIADVEKILAAQAAQTQEGEGVIQNG